MRIITLFIFLFVSFHAGACSFMRVIEKFEHTKEATIEPSRPNFSVNDITRGTIGESGSCNDAGILSLAISPEPEDTGYIFSIVDGTFEDQLFPSGPVIRIRDTIKPSSYFFVWLDGYSTEQEPIDITVKIVAVSKDGGVSEPQLLKVVHPGVKKAWWKFW